jgi:2-iminobutanoate/2-iminopropanoate deaminase
MPCRRAIVRGLLVVVPVFLYVTSARAQERHVYNPPGSPTNLPFSNGIQVGNTLYLAGVQGTKSDDIGAETQSALANLKKVLDAAGFKPSDVVKVTVYLKDINDFPKMNAVYREFFPDPKPTRTTVEVARLVNDAHIEITSEAVRSVGGGGQ